MPCWLCVLGLDVGSDKLLAWSRAEVTLHFLHPFFFLFFQKVVQEELDALLEQQSTIENKMVALHRMGLVLPTRSPSFSLLHDPDSPFTVVGKAHPFSENVRL